MVPKRYSLFGVPLLQWFAVLAIIAFMYAVLFPVFRKIEDSSGHAHYCHSNMQQLGLAIIQYTQDSNERYPSGVNAAGNGWAGQLHEYIKSKDVYKCPQDPQDDSYISYAENRNIVGKNYGQFAAQEATVAFYETTTLNCDPATLETVSATGISAPQDSIRHDSPQFHFALNFLLTDGHVMMLTPGQVSGGPNAALSKHKGAYAATFAIR